MNSILDKIYAFGKKTGQNIVDFFITPLNDKEQDFFKKHSAPTTPHHKGSSGKGSSGKGSRGKGSRGKGNSGKGSSGKGNPNDKRSFIKKTNGNNGNQNSSNGADSSNYDSNDNIDYDNANTPDSKKFTPGFTFGDNIDQQIADAAKHFKISEKFLRGLIKMEDGWTGLDSKTRAVGPGQFTKSTWDGLANSPEGKAIGMTPIGNRFLKPEDPRRNTRINILATALLASQNIQYLIKHKIKPSAENVYMLHNAGHIIASAMRGSDTTGSKAGDKSIRSIMDVNGGKGLTPTQFLAMQTRKYRNFYNKVNGLKAAGTPNKKVPTTKTATKVKKPTTESTPTEGEAQLPTEVSQHLPEDLTRKGLRIKNDTEDNSGGALNPALYLVAHMLQNGELKGNFQEITAGNDAFHRRLTYSSQHTRGLAFDFTLNNGKKGAKAATTTIAEMLTRYGQIVNFSPKQLAKMPKKQVDYLVKNHTATVLDEYNYPSKHATGHHIHVEFKTREEAKKFLNKVKAMGISSTQTSKGKAATNNSSVNNKDVGLILNQKNESDSTGASNVPDASVASAASVASTNQDSSVSDNNTDVSPTPNQTNESNSTGASNVPDASVASVASVASDASANQDSSVSDSNADVSPTRNQTNESNSTGASDVPDVPANQNGSVSDGRGKIRIYLTKSSQKTNKLGNVNQKKTPAQLIKAPSPAENFINNASWSDRASQATYNNYNNKTEVTMMGGIQVYTTADTIKDITSLAHDRVMQSTTGIG